MFDSHTHLNIDPLYQTSQEVYDQASQAGVEHFLIPGVNQDSSLKGIELSNKLAGVSCAIGYHPDQAEQLLTTQSTQDIYHWLQQTAQESKESGVVALGETGLDYYRLPDDKLARKHQITAQKKLFKLHIKVALELDLPVIVHVRDAQADALSLLEKYRPKAVLHCFSGNLDYLNRSLELGCYISFAGNITFANGKDLLELSKHVPADRLFCETDSPFLNPDRGKWPNTPEKVVQVYQALAQSRDMSLEDLKAQISSNRQEFFGLE